MLAAHSPARSRRGLSLDANGPIDNNAEEHAAPLRCERAYATTTFHRDHTQTPTPVVRLTTTPQHRSMAGYMPWTPMRVLRRCSIPSLPVRTGKDRAVRRFGLFLAGGNATSMPPPKQRWQTYQR